MPVLVKTYPGQYRKIDMRSNGGNVLVEFTDVGLTMVEGVPKPELNLLANGLASSMYLNVEINIEVEFKPDKPGQMYKTATYAGRLEIVYTDFEEIADE